MRRVERHRGLFGRLFHGHPWLYVIFVIAIGITCYTAVVNLYYFWEIKQKISDLNDPKVIEKKAREDLGLVKDGEVPYIK